MKIWLANHYAVPPNIAGITRHYELAKEWAEEEGAEVDLWMSRFVHPRRSWVTEEEKKAIKPVKGLRLNWLWSFPHKVNDFRRMVNMASFAVVFFFRGLFKKRPDVLIASSPHLFLAFTGWMLAAIKRVPFVFEVRDLWPDSLIKMGGLNNKHIIRILTWMENHLYRKADQIVVLTEHQRTFIEERGIDPSKIELIPNGVVLGSWEPSPETKGEFRKRMGIAEDEFLAIYTGAHGPANALEYVVRAGQYLEPGTSIVLIGDGPEKEKLVRLREELGLTNVHLLDPVAKSEIFDYTYAADCGIISLADNEVFRGARPNKLFDYTFLGKPIVSTVDGEVREIVENNEVGIFAGAENPEGLAESIAQVRRYSDEKKAQIAANGLDYIDREGDRKKLAHKFYLRLQELVSRKK